MMSIQKAYFLEKNLNDQTKRVLDSHKQVTSVYHITKRILRAVES